MTTRAAEYIFEDHPKKVIIKYQPDVAIEKESDIKIKFFQNAIVGKINKNTPFIEGALFESIDVEDSFWVKEKNGIISITCSKINEEEWPCAVVDTYEENIDAHSCYLISQYFSNGKSYEAALPFLQQAADKNHYFASYLYGSIYYFQELGWGVELDEEKALKYFKISIELGNDYAAFLTGDSYQKGIGCEIDYKKAVEYFKRSIKLKRFEVYENLGNIYLEGGYGVEQNFKLAFENFLLASQHESATAMYELGKMYIYGRGTERNFEEARKYFEQAIQMNSNIEIDQVLLDILDKGIEVFEKNLNHEKEKEKEIEIEIEKENANVEEEDSDSDSDEDEDEDEDGINEENKVETNQVKEKKKEKIEKDKENEKKKEKIEKKKSSNFLLIGSTVAATTLIGLGIYYLRKRTQKKEQK
ncbi:sel1-repeat-containing protein ybeq [Anaeramoeba flamelloides]|uniref:Sel1-repeat-containing protein ybeq n=1 Tax=Anaeramoeba flamelloides TaxID=1746091 RepID=A0AAV7ZXH5_9EUKA|nr:sel1-repeat-containing protein ybeq [Anaeramoeba flamelloides]